MLRKTFVLLSVRLSSYGYYGRGESPCQRSGTIHQSLFYHHDVEHRSLNPRGSIRRSSIQHFIDIGSSDPFIKASFLKFLKYLFFDRKIILSLGV